MMKNNKNDLVTASVNHNVKNDTVVSTSRYSLFTYGGVLIQPNINIVKGNGAPLGGTPVSITASSSNQGGSGSGGAGSSGGGAGSSGGGGSGGGNKPVDVLMEAFKQAQPTRGKPNQLETILSDGSKVLFRRDVGPYAHNSSDHYNIEVQIPHPNKPAGSGRFTTIQNAHIVLNEKLEPVSIKISPRGINNERNLHNRSKP